MKYRKGKLCPKCQEGKLEKSGCDKGAKRHKGHLECKTCGWSNF